MMNTTRHNLCNRLELLSFLYVSNYPSPQLHGSWDELSFFTQRFQLAKKPAVINLHSRANYKERPCQKERFHFWKGWKDFAGFLWCARAWSKQVVHSLLFCRTLCTNPFQESPTERMQGESSCVGKRQSLQSLLDEYNNATIRMKITALRDEFPEWRPIRYFSTICVQG